MTEWEGPVPVPDARVRRPFPVPDGVFSAKLKGVAQPLASYIRQAQERGEAGWAATGDSEMQRRAAALGEAIRAEDGVAQAVAEILRLVGALAG
ncbi:hypothetical protein [Symbiobacterium terraclitae]|uniref:hypothetical protein n=1 Tax=Symbiobacterium terraclitae TaxID=557451 RepID=UPI0035B54D1D